MERGIMKLKNILEGKTESQFSSEDYIMLYITIYNMCTQKSLNDYFQQLYEKYKEHSMNTLHQQNFVTWWSLFALNDVGPTCFHDLVYQELNVKVRDAIIALASLILSFDTFFFVLRGQMDYYENDFEVSMLEDTFYSIKASNWIVEDSCPDYMLKVCYLLLCRHCNTSYWSHILVNCLRRSILDVMPCLEMIRLMIYLGCTGYSIKFQEDLIQWRICLSSLSLMKVRF